MRPTRTRTLRGCAALVVGATTLMVGGGDALADELMNFEILEFSGNNGLTLDDRIGTATTASTDRRFINIVDCDNYAGGSLKVEVRFEPPTEYDRAVGAHYSQFGMTCPATEAEPTGDDGCFNSAETVTTEGLYERIELDVEIDFLTGGDCEAGGSGTAKIYFVAEYSDSAGFDESNASTIDISVDLDAPSAPTITAIEGGDQRLIVSFDDNVNDTQGDITYRLYWSDEPITAANKASAATKTTTTAGSYTLESDAMSNGTLYYVRIEAEDAADNASPLSNEFEGIPMSTTDFWEYYLAKNGAEKGGHCFVATAAWGTPMAGELGTLRAFRDGVLLPSAAGSAFVDWYYRWGRFAAAAIADRPLARAAVRVGLTPLVWFAQLANRVGGLAALLLVLAGLAGLVILVRRALARWTPARRWRGRRSEVPA